MNRLILRLLKHTCFDSSGYDPEKMEKWLSSLYEDADRGYKHWYIYRERKIKEDMANDPTPDKYKELYGRLLEIKLLKAQSQIIYEKTKK